MKLANDPWGDDGNSPSFEICVCCGAEFGYHDFTLEGVRNHRNKWFMSGKKWHMPEFGPKNWNFEEQFKNISQEWI